MKLLPIAATCTQHTISISKALIKHVKIKYLRNHLQDFNVMHILRAFFFTCYINEAHISKTVKIWFLKLETFTI